MLRAATVALPLLLALPGATARAECGCLWQGGFADVQGRADAVVAATVAQRKGNSIDVEVARKLRGEVFFDRLRVWLKTGDYCRPPAEDFPVGSRWVLALVRIDEVPEGGFDPTTPSVSYGRAGDYLLSSCGGYWLQWTGEAVTGNLIDAPRWAREPKMSPVLLDLLAAYVAGEVGRDALREASREDPALRELMLDTRQFLFHGEVPAESED